MVTLIIGGSGSGKSAYAEDYICTLAKGKQKYYLATMKVWDEEGRVKVEKHRKLREGRGFLTIEQPVSIFEAYEAIDNPRSSVLLECMSNLVANEMFADEKVYPMDFVADKIVKEILELKEQVEDLVIVSNNVFEDGIIYDEMTMAYLAALGNINARLAKAAEEVIELVVGIPLTIKKGKWK